MANTASVSWGSGPAIDRKTPAASIGAAIGSGHRTEGEGGSGLCRGAIDRGYGRPARRDDRPPEGFRPGQGRGTGA